MTFIKQKDDGGGNNSKFPTDKEDYRKFCTFRVAGVCLIIFVVEENTQTHTYAQETVTKKHTQRKEIKRVKIHSKRIQDRQAEAEQSDRQRFRLGSCSGANGRDDLFPGSPSLPLSIPSSHCRPPLCPLSQFLS
ncbi:hypothetical protein GOODEAATRI_022089 [Goodea atripinnis]|uniref:Uncharacterized protein n=1 Tax=Goodea atripinnis TaxID=208336 RepID=A0ABV0P6W6_9TELE